MDPTAGPPIFPSARAAAARAAAALHVDRRARWRGPRPAPLTHERTLPLFARVGIGAAAGGVRRIRRRRAEPDL